MPSAVGTHAGAWGWADVVASGGAVRASGGAVMAIGGAETLTSTLGVVQTAASRQTERTSPTSWMA